MTDWTRTFAESQGNPSSFTVALSRAYAWPTAFELVDGLLVASKRAATSSEVTFIALHPKTLAIVRVETRHEFEPPDVHDFVRQACVESPRIEMIWDEVTHPTAAEGLVIRGLVGVGKRRYVDAALARLPKARRR